MPFRKLWSGNETVRSFGSRVQRMSSSVSTPAPITIWSRSAMTFRFPRMYSAIASRRSSSPWGSLYEQSRSFCRRAALMYRCQRATSKLSRSASPLDRSKRGFTLPVKSRAGFGAACFVPALRDT